MRPTMKMRLFLLAWLTLVATADVVHAQSPTPGTPAKQADVETWKRYTVTGEKFSVTLPSVPLLMTREGLLTGSKKVRAESLLGVHGGGAVYAVYICENPKGKQSLQDFIVEQTRLDGWHLASEQIIKVDGATGKQYQSMSTVPSTAQFFAVEDRLYQFRVVGASADTDGVKRFFSSISFKNLDGLAVSSGPDVSSVGTGVETVFTAREVDVKARLLTKPLPSFPESAREKRISGTIILKVVLTSRGIVDNIQIVQAVRGLTEHAIEAARKIKFMPAMKDGKYVSTTLQLEYSLSYS